MGSIFEATRNKTVIHEKQGKQTQRRSHNGQSRWEQTLHKRGNRTRFWEGNIIPYRYPIIGPWERSPGNDYNEYGRSNQIGRWTGSWRDQMGYW